MRKFLVLAAVVLLVCSTGTAFARVNPDAPRVLDATQVLDMGDVGSQAGQQVGLKDFPSDTLCYGWYELRSGVPYALAGEKWTFDHGSADPLEGWTFKDLTAQVSAYIPGTGGIDSFWRWMGPGVWAAEQNILPAPTMVGDGFALCGAREGFADSLAWDSGAGYGNGFCQKLTSPTLTYDGSGTVNLSLKYFQESEGGYDYTYVEAQTAGDPVILNNETGLGWSGTIGIAAGVITPETYARPILASELGGTGSARPLNIIIHFVADGGWSDEDGFDCVYGPVGIDDVAITDNVSGGLPLYDFETGLQGWTPTPCEGVGSFCGINDIGTYNILDPCPCSLQGNVLEMHDDNLQHPDGQHVMCYSPILDRENDVPDYLSYNRIFAKYDSYNDLPVVNGVYYRSGWTYYPSENPQVPGMNIWSPRTGIGTFYYAGGTPACTIENPARGSVGTDWGLPADAKQVKLIYELYGSCAAFGQDPCSGITNFSPLLDNIQICNVGRILAPAILLTTGSKYHDGFGMDNNCILSTTDPGNSDMGYDLRRTTTNPTLLADSLVIAGAPATAGGTGGAPNNQWEARLWFHVKHAGPGQANPAYTTWLDRSILGVAGGPLTPASTALGGARYGAVRPDLGFCYAWMDRVVATSSHTARSYQYCSRYRSESRGLTPGYPSGNPQWVGRDPGYSSTASDFDPHRPWNTTARYAESNEILPDGLFTPGTKIEYYITSNYSYTQELMEKLPGDGSADGDYYEYEILPSYRMDGETAKFPCMLYVDGYDGRGIPRAEYFVEQALYHTLHPTAPAGDPIPDPAEWDRYDYQDASSNWNPTMIRRAGDLAGACITQLLGYNTIILSTGNLDVGWGEPEDLRGLKSWMDTPLISPTEPQKFLANGTMISAIMNGYPILNENLGATHTCASYNAAGCPTPDNGDQNYCVRLLGAPGTPLFSCLPYTPIDVYSNWCSAYVGGPAKLSYNVLAAADGVPSMEYSNIATGVPAVYSSMTKINTVKGYRSIIDDQSLHMMIVPHDIPDAANECMYGTYAATNQARVDAGTAWMTWALDWLGGINAPPCAPVVGLCVNPIDVSSVPGEDGSGSVAVTRLYQNHPNPFNPRTEIKFSLAADGPAKLIIYDVNGRRIRTLVDNGLKAGMHQVIWDGTDDSGHTVTSGVYWSQLHAGDFSSNKKMVVLK